mmetsp:Transcript_29808/g.81789  ORF Transcript_29808/g.81789 Transcript_29808/m.81789 type:complete len:264 (-) Transcript_29808:305-1096(-)
MIFTRTTIAIGKMRKYLWNKDLSSATLPANVEAASSSSFAGTSVFAFPTNSSIKAAQPSRGFLRSSTSGRSNSTLTFFMASSSVVTFSNQGFCSSNMSSMVPSSLSRGPEIMSSTVSRSLTTFTLALAKTEDNTSNIMSVLSLCVLIKLEQFKNTAIAPASIGPRSAPSCRKETPMAAAIEAAAAAIGVTTCAMACCFASSAFCASSSCIFVAVSSASRRAASAFACASFAFLFAAELAAAPVVLICAEASAPASSGATAVDE